MNELIKLLQVEETFIQKRRTRALATQQWDKAIECDAEQKLIDRLKKGLKEIALAEVKP